MFLRTDLTYNDNGDIFYFEENGSYRNSYKKYSKSKLTPKEKYVQMYRAQLKADKLPLSDREAQRDTRSALAAVFSASKLLVKYYERKASGAPLLPHQKRIEEILALSEEEINQLPELTGKQQSGLNRVSTLLNVPNDDQSIRDRNVLVRHGYKFTPFKEWNQETDPLQTKEQKRRQKAAEEWDRRWGDVRFRLPADVYDPERMEWRDTLASREQAIRDDVARQQEIEMDVGGDADLARRLQEEWAGEGFGPVEDEGFEINQFVFGPDDDEGFEIIDGNIDELD